MPDDAPVAIDTPDRSEQKEPVPPLRFGNCELRLDTREVLLNGRSRAVRRRVFDLLVYLIRQRPRTVPKAELLHALWQRRDTAPALLARAVMEARRAVGDLADDPQHIISVHGVGYRFAGSVSNARLDVASADEEVPIELSEVRELITQARAAMLEGRLAQAQEMAERAMARADRMASHAEKVRALIVCSTLAMRRSNAPLAARLAMQALGIAKAEGHPPLIAQARVATALVHLFAGDLETATRHLQESRGALSQPGYELELARCLSLLALALRSQGALEAGLQVCRQSMELKRRCQAPNLVVDRTNEVLLLLGNRHGAQGEPERARQCFETALALNTELLHDIDASGPRSARRACLSNRSGVLERLNRLDEAWEALRASDEEVESLAEDASPLGSDNEQTRSMHRANLMARSGRIDQALDEIRVALAAAERSGQPQWLPDLYGQASEIAERAGLLEQALTWARCRHDAQAGVQTAKAASLAAVLAAELNVDELQAHLQGAQARIRDLLQDNDELRRRVHRIEEALDSAQDSGLAGARRLVVAFAGAFERAQTRELPMCIGLLTLLNPQACGGPDPSEGLKSLCAQANDVLGGFDDVAPRTVSYRPEQIAFHVQNAGVRRAVAVCREIVERLENLPASHPGLTEKPRWHCASADATTFPSPEACVEQLSALGLLAALP